MSGAQGPFAPPPPAGVPPSISQPPPPAASSAPPLHGVATRPPPPEHPRPSTSTSGPLVLAGVLATLAVGLGYYAFVLWQGQQTAEVELKTTRGQVDQLKQERVVTQKRVVALEQEKKQGDNALSEAQQQARDLTARLAVAEGKLDELKQERAEIEQQLAEFRSFTKSFQRMIDSGRLEVSFRRGRMIVELPAQVLFPSGSADLTDEGKQALREVAKVLRKIRGKRFIVGGHTDNVPVSTKEFPSNWELSSGRALKVIHALVRAGMSPRRLVAAGYGPYDPVASNKSSRGRRRNRRIEIILEPKLREVPNL
ncbi:MAG: OmpA family protein [Myxococcales bacterium]|nr:OmpA family protein [Myxococcales bacterium]MDD9970538.1 OmpA family protein [Myxococcales bacterium]